MKKRHIGRAERSHLMRRAVTNGAVAFILIIGVGLATAQTEYQPKFKGDPAHSDSEAVALGYMRTVIRAQTQYQRKNGTYAASLSQLVHTGSFTRRMTETDRGDYKVNFRTHKDGYELALNPKQQDAQHRSFYANDDGKIHADEEKAATEDSAVLK